MSRYCLVAIGILLGGVLYWFMWRKVLPRLGHYKLYPTKEVLKDGTVVTVVRKLSRLSRYPHSKYLFHTVQETKAYLTRGSGWTILFLPSQKIFARRTGTHACIRFSCCTGCRISGYSSLVILRWRIVLFTYLCD